MDKYHYHRLTIFVESMARLYLLDKKIELSRVLIADKKLILADEVTVNMNKKIPKISDKSYFLCLFPL